MRITRLHLRNYRVYEDALDLELPPGLVGIYGPNGSGKSYLIEAIRWTLYGRSRTANDEIRTAGVNGDCVTEVELEHEGHLYVVRRTITGTANTVRAEAHWNGQQVAEGPRDVAAYIHSVLGMDDAAFRASVFAEQKQVAAFSSQGPQKRRELVLRLLGITPLDKARDSVRADARAARTDHERLAGRLPDLTELDDAVRLAEEALATAASRVAAAEQVATGAADARSAAEARTDDLDDRHRTWSELVTEGKAAAAARDDAVARLTALTAEAAGLDEAEARLAELRPQAAGVDALEARLRDVEVVVAARAALDALPAAETPDRPDEDAAEAARRAAADAREVAAALEGAVGSARAELARAQAAAERSADLAPDEDCPVCGQSLGDALEQVQAHRASEVDAARARLADAEAQHRAAVAGVQATVAAADEAAATLKAAQQRWAIWEQAEARRADAEAALATALARLDPPPVDGEADRLRADVAARRRAGDEVARLEGRLERRDALSAEIAAVTARRDEAAATRDALLDKVRALDFSPEQLQAARTARAEARQVHEQAAADLQTARVASARAEAEVDAARARLVDGRDRHAEIADLAVRARHLGRLSDLLGDFRNNVVATVGPRLAAQAAELFAELTDHEYDALLVDADTYDIQIQDAGRTYGMDRFSGSETDLANLALRVAISEQVRFQSGGAVGLLVLDEVFGPLDEDRKDRMLQALERLRGRFRQVLVVTHDAAIKEQLPSAVQVEKQPGRRATARLLAAG